MLSDVLFFLASVFWLQAMPTRLLLIYCSAVVITTVGMVWWRQ